ncbi:MAG: hypothetical protein K0R02_999 [Rickettsiaceae bacterium]|jgi:hypothetical protein|nr:hypothetical protein [Rickettsiaceae bacterium]
MQIYKNLAPNNFCTYTNQHNEIFDWYKQLKANNIPTEEMPEYLTGLTGFSQEFILFSLYQIKWEEGQQTSRNYKVDLGGNIKGDKKEAILNKGKNALLDSHSSKDNDKKPYKAEPHIAQAKLLNANDYQGDDITLNYPKPTKEEIDIYKKSEELVFKVSKDLYQSIFKTQYGLEYNHVMEIIYKVKIYEKSEETVLKNLSNNHSEIIKQNEQDKNIYSVGSSKSELSPQDYGDSYTSIDNVVTNIGECAEDTNYSKYL